MTDDDDAVGERRFTIPINPDPVTTLARFSERIPHDELLCVTDEDAGCQCDCDPCFVGDCYE